jgi:hypothetical protein
VTYDKNIDNGIGAIGAEVTVDGLKFYSTVAGVVRYRTTSNTSNPYAAAGHSVWNTNGAFFTNNTTLIGAVGSTLPTNVRTYIAIPVSSGTAFSLSLSYKQTSSTATAGKIAFVGSNGIVLAEQNADIGQAGSTLTYNASVGHALTYVKIIYGREGISSGGANIWQIVRTQ